LGFNDKSALMGPAKMYEALKRKYPGRLDLPSEGEIRQAISIMMTKIKKSLKPTLCRTRGILEPYNSTVLTIFVDSEGNITPSQAWIEFQRLHPADSEAPSTSVPSERQVKNKISNLKSKFKATGAMPSI